MPHKKRVFAVVMMLAATPVTARVTTLTFTHTHQ